MTYERQDRSELKPFDLDSLVYLDGLSEEARKASEGLVEVKEWFENKIKEPIKNGLEEIRYTPDGSTIVGCFTELEGSSDKNFISIKKSSDGLYFMATSWRGKCIVGKSINCLDKVLESEWNYINWNSKRFDLESI